VPIATPISPGRPTGRTDGGGAGVLRIDPYLVELEESRYSVHGNDERISLENIEFGLRLYVETLIEMQDAR
jgi:hypothetical protein